MADDEVPDPTALELYILRLVELVEEDEAVILAMNVRERAAVALVLNKPELGLKRGILATVAALPPDWLAAAICIGDYG